MDLKSNINKIHADLLNNFSSVEIFEKTSKEFQEYIEIVTVHENKKLMMIISKREIEKNNFNWKYYSNPNSEDSLVDRNSTIDSFLENVKDIFEKNRFDSDYLENIN
jgi:hypothetical protein